MVYYGQMMISAIALAGAIPLLQMSQDALAERLSKCSPASSLSRFLDYPNAFTGKATISPAVNPNFWLRGVDFSCVSPWNSQYGRFRAGTAISKRHIVFAKHFPIAEGTRIIFADDEIGVCPCYLESTMKIEKADIVVGLLNSELSPNIRPAKILPPDFEKFMGDCDGFPVVTFNQHEKVFLNELISIKTNVYHTMWSCSVPRDSHRAAYREKIVSGDSGNPAFLLIGNEPIFLYCLTTGGAGGGFPIHGFRREVQAAMDALCPGYRLECFDFAKMKVEK